MPVPSRVSAGTAAWSSTNTLLAIVLVLMLACLGWSTWIGYRLVSAFVPQVEATLSVRLEVTEAHLWLEEIVSGDGGEDRQAVFRLLDRAGARLNALAAGGVVDGDAVMPLADEGLLVTVRGAQSALAGFRAIARERLDSAEGGVGSDLDSRFDHAFEVLVGLMADLDVRLRAAITRSLAVFVGTQVALMLAVGGVFAWIGFLLRQKERTVRDRHLREQQEAFARLEASQAVLARQNELRGHLVDLEKELRGVDDPAEYARRMLFQLCGRCGALVGTAWLCVPGRGLRRLAGYALPPELAGLEWLEDGEGLAGAAARDGQAISLRNAGGMLRISSAIGDTASGHVEVRPVLHEGRVVAVFELGFLDEPPEQAVAVLAAVLESCGLRFALYSQAAGAQLGVTADDALAPAAS